MLLLLTAAFAGPWVEIPIDWHEVSPGDTEISGMDWLDEAHLLVLPQSRDAPTHLLILDATVIADALDGHPVRDAILAAPSMTYPIRTGSPLLPGLRFGGFEAVYTEPDGSDAWVLWLVSEWESDDASGAGACVHRTHLTTDDRTWTLSDDLEQVWCARMPAAIPNSGIEAVVAVGDERLAVPEYLGASQGVYDLATGLAHPERSTFPWRVTDATRVRAGRVWITNVLWNGEAGVYASGDPERVECVPEKHVRSCGRLVEVSWDGEALVEHRSLSLDIAPFDRTENWEGVVRFDHRGHEGVLLATDRHTSEDQPRTILAWVDVSQTTEKHVEPAATPTVPAFRPMEERRFATTIEAGAPEIAALDTAHGIVDQLLRDPTFRGLVEARHDLFVRCAGWSQERLDTAAFFSALADGPRATPAFREGAAALASVGVGPGSVSDGWRIQVDEDAVQAAVRACPQPGQVRASLVNTLMHETSHLVWKHDALWVTDRCPRGSAVFQRRRFADRRASQASYQLGNMAQCYLAARTPDDELDVAGYQACLAYPLQGVGTTLHPSGTACVEPL